MSVRLNVQCTNCAWKGVRVVVSKPHPSVKTRREKPVIKKAVRKSTRRAGKVVLAMTQKPVNVVDYKDLEKAIDAYYKVPKNRPFSVVAQMEWHNDSTHEFDVEALDAEANEEGEVIAAVHNGSTPMFELDVILNDLCFHKVIPAGEYLVQVSW